MRKLRTIMSLLLVFLLIVSAHPGCDAKDESSIKTGIIGAVDEEVDSLKAAVSDAKITLLGGMEFCEGMLDGHFVVIVRCGVGKVNAGNCAQLLISVFGVDRVINSDFSRLLSIGTPAFAPPETRARSSSDFQY
jgi:adenosylhomocysteine nucleosidase